MSSHPPLKFPRFADLNGLATELESDPNYKGVVAIIRKAAVAQACVGDLSQAQSCCEALDDLLASPRKQGTMTRSTTEAALLQSAVILYARATATAGKMGERGSVQVTKKLTPEQLADHQFLVRVRNRAIAHVYGDEPIEGEIWHRHEMFLVEVDRVWQPAGATKRFQFHKKTFDRLKRQIPVAHGLVTNAFHRHLNKLVAAMNANPIPLEAFERHLFNPVERFDGVQGAKSVLAGKATGHISFLTQ